ncbi:MAG: hypothetical protein Tsb002_07550 [Wenzhouxiangellaceae bacterium]
MSANHLRQVRRNFLCSLILLSPVLVMAQDISDQYQIQRGAETWGDVVYPVAVSVDMATVPKPQPWQPGDPIIEYQRRGNGIPPDWEPPSPRQFNIDPLVARARAASGAGGAGIETQLINVPGNPGNGVQPPDTNGDVGPQYYIQAINGTNVVVLDKTDGTVVTSFTLGSLAAGSGTGCNVLRSDPVVFFDQFAGGGEGRWVLTEFTSNSLCFFISQTVDPTTGDWFIYEFTSASGGIPDYHKYGVWPDFYYAGANEGFSGGRSNYAFDRTNMLLGQPARPVQVFSSPTLNGYFFQLLLAADADGATPPPAGAPGILLRKRDDEAHTNDGGTDDPVNDFIDYWEMTIDFDNSANSTFAGPTSVPIAEFDADLCGLTNFNCVPQTGSGIVLDSVAETLMWRVQYRRFDDRQVMLSSFVVDVDGNDLHGVRWFVLERPADDVSGGWTLAQEGTQSLDSTHRWMSSIAMDGSRNIVMGYSVSDNAGTFPGIRYAGQANGDPAGTLPRGEFTAIDGSAANNGGRWGDYASMSVDPVNDCVFYFTSMYNPASNWQTRVFSVEFDVCGELPEVFFIDGFESPL